MDKNGRETAMGHKLSNAALTRVIGPAMLIPDISNIWARISIQNGENKTGSKKCSIYIICPSQQIMYQSYIQATKKKLIQNRPNLENVFASNTAQEVFYRAILCIFIHEQIPLLNGVYTQPNI